MSQPASHETHQSNPAPESGDAPSSFVREYPRYDRMLQAAQTRMLDAAGLRAGDCVLDVGCGAGSTTLAAASRVGPRGTAVGVDQDAAAVRLARERARRDGVTQASFLRADASTADLSTLGADAVVSRFGTLHFQDRVAAYRHLSGALRPGGRLVFLTFAEPEENPWATLPADCLRRALPGVPIPRVERAGPFALADPDLIRTILGAAGYASIEVRSLDEPLWFGDDVKDALEFYFETDGRALAARLDDSQIARACEALEGALQPHTGPQGVHLPARLWLVHATPA